jgi:hypothetical protein
MTSLDDDIEYFKKCLCSALGLDYAEFKEHIVCTSLLDCNSPLRDLYLQELEQARIQLRVKGLLV